MRNGLLPHHRFGQGVSCRILHSIVSYCAAASAAVLFVFGYAKPVTTEYYYSFGEQVTQPRDLERIM